MIFYACLFIIIFVIDLEHGLILNRVVYPSMVVALLLALLPQSWLTQETWLTQVIEPGIASAALGGAIGFPLVFLAIIMAAILGGIVAVALLIAKKRNRRQTIPFGPFLALAAMVTLLWGSNILNWYLGLMQ
jgi:leader peptidase (prepilin peptidase)/N-methyltransferase